MVPMQRSMTLAAWCLWTGSIIKPLFEVTALCGTPDRRNAVVGAMRQR
jgi:hypothetical protein